MHGLNWRVNYVVLDYLLQQSHLVQCNPFHCARFLPSASYIIYSCSIVTSTATGVPEMQEGWASFSFFSSSSGPRILARQILQQVPQQIKWNNNHRLTPLCIRVLTFSELLLLRVYVLHNSLLGWRASWKIFKRTRFGFRGIQQISLTKHIKKNSEGCRDRIQSLLQEKEWIESTDSQKANKNQKVVDHLHDV